MMICKICLKHFKPTHHTQKCCSSECKTINTHKIKRKYYEAKVQPFLPGPRIKKTEEELKQYQFNYNNTPERKQYMKEYKQKVGVKQKERESVRRYKKRNPDVAKNGHLKRNFDISLEKFNEMLESQNYVCSICKQPETKIFKKTGKLCDFCVDHCHSTGKVRGLLCWNCNASLGKFKDSIETLENAILYLKKHKEVK